MKTSTVILVIAGIAVAAAAAMTHGRAEQAHRRAEIAEGYRGIILELSPNQLAWVKKGDSVDVISVFEAVMKDDKKEKVGATLLQNVKVVGVNARKGTIVLLVNPTEAQYAALSKMQGTVNLSLRGPGDKALKPMEIASYRRLIK
jgi:Flp pilus assembly protein CpaB